MICGSPGLLHSLLFCFDNLAHCFWSIPLCTLCTSNTFSPTHDPPSPSLGYIGVNEAVWNRHKSSVNVGNVETAALKGARQLLTWLSISPRSGLQGGREIQHAVRGPRGHLPHGTGLIDPLYLGNCQRSLQAFSLCERNIKEEEAGTSIWLTDKKVSSQMTHFWRSQTELFRGHDLQENSIAGIYLFFRAC